jgi:hypothetical protein
MPKPEASANRHEFRVWLKWALESGLLEKLPPQCDADGCEPPQPTDQYARGLLAELRDPELSTRPLKQIIADARQFRIWVEACQKQCRRMILAEIHPGDLGEWAPLRQSSNPAGQEEEPQPTTRKPPNPGRNPMWDDWLDS